MSRRSNARKRERQKLKYANRPNPVPVPAEKPSVSRGLINESLERLSPLAQAILNQERIQQP
jgi:hypothetical protein